MPTTSNFGWTTPADTDLVKDGALAIRTLGNGIDTSMAELKGGTTGQVLSKTSNTDMDFTWVTTDDANAIQNAIVDAKGDLITATANDTPARLGVGTNGQVLTADSTTATGLKWAAAAGGGKVLQVVEGTYNTAVSNSTTTYADTGLTASITPSSASSKVLVFVNHNGFYMAQPASGSNSGRIKLYRGATEISSADYGYATTQFYAGSCVQSILDTPATTSATTYKTQFISVENKASITLQSDNRNRSSIILMEIGA
jgi:hypothetical protein